jgi:hypothetical protein
MELPKELAKEIISDAEQNGVSVPEYIDNLLKYFKCSMQVEEEEEGEYANLRIMY